MRYFLLSVLVWLIAVAPASAQTQQTFTNFINGVQIASPLTGSERVPVTQNGLTKAMVGNTFLATQNSNNVLITGGAISGVTLSGAMNFSGKVTFSGIFALGSTTSTATGTLAACAMPVCVWQPGTPASTTWPLPSVPTDGEQHTVENWLQSGIYALTVTASAPILTGSSNSSSFVLTNPGEVVTFRYIAALSKWVTE